MAFGQEVFQSISSVGKVNSEHPQECKLNQNYPNPFNPATNIDYTLNKSGEVILQIYNADGVRIRTLLNNRQSSGKHLIRWDGRDDFGNQVASGAYFYKLKFNGNIISKKMLKMK